MYNTLQPKQFRALKVLNYNPIQLEIQTLDLSEAPRYVALSYTWGSAPYQKGRSKALKYEIILNDVVTAVHQNLHDALAHLLPDVKARGLSIFVDAICINQNNLGERASQVRLMREIYEGAAMVLCWLGVPYDEEETRLAVKQMQRFRAILLKARTGENDENIFDFEASVSLENELLFPLQSDSETYRAWTGINEMFNQPYWHRTWVMQEATGPAKTKYFCGNFVFNKMHLSATLYFGHLYSDVPSANREFAKTIGFGGSAANLDGLRNLDGSFSRYGATDPTSLVELCQSFRNTKATDPRDKVFAPRNLASDVDKTLVPPDYTRHYTDVYRDVARMYLLRDASLDIFGYVVHPSPDSTAMQGSPQDTSIPSWVPDWRHRIKVKPLPKLRDNISEVPMYDATKKVKMGLPYIAGSCLHVRGHEVDVITDMCSICEGSELECVNAWLATLKFGANDVYPHSHGETYEQAFWTTVVADLSYDAISRTYRRGRSFSVPRKSPKSKAEVLERDSFQLPMSLVCVGRRLTYTKGGHVAMVPAATRIGDRVTILSHGSVPFVLRHVTGNHLSLVGECYVHGIMDGEAITRDITWKTFVLV